MKRRLWAPSPTFVIPPIALFVPPVRRVLVLAALLAAIVLSVSDPSSATSSTTGNTYGSIKIGLRGWGSVVLGRGFVDTYHAIKCFQESWCVASRFASSGLAVAKAYPRKGWKFVRWTGACTGKNPKCTVSVKDVHPDTLGYRHARLTATFVPAVPGFTRSWPAPVGHFGRTDPRNGYRLRVNSVTANASLSPAAPAGRSTSSPTSR